MKKQILIAAAGGLMAVPSLFAQTGVFQFNWNAGAVVENGGFGNQVVKGKPFSATEESRSVQVLGDGTRIENNQTNKLYRDNEGRTRVERANGVVTINDPVAGFRAELNTSTKVAKASLPGARVVLEQAEQARVQAELAQVQLKLAEAQAMDREKQRIAAKANAIPGELAPLSENLTPQITNGVLAQGTRTTTTIPRGQIGNDREIKVITERWFSNDLQMLVKSVNKDPRFGDTSYDLTNISRDAPNASLFQIPADYTTSGPEAGRGRGGRGGRGGAPSNPQ